MTSPKTEFMETAYLTALYRAIESERPDALFHDTYAEQLVGEKRADIEQKHPRLHSESWGVTVRTAIIDTMITRSLEQGVDTVLNLAAGLDTRPYRLTLPSSLHWIEVDLPELLEYKEQKLANEQPCCEIERIALDLLDTEARRTLFAHINLQAGQILVLSEGFLSYLHPKQVMSLAQDLTGHSAFRWWITEFLPSYVMMNGNNATQREHAFGDENAHFAPEDGVKFFLNYGWGLAEYHSLLGAAARLKRHVPLGWLLRPLEFIARITSDDPKTYRHAGGFILLERASPPEKSEETVED